MVTRCWIGGLRIERIKLREDEHIPILDSICKLVRFAFGALSLPFIAFEIQKATHLMMRFQTLE